MGTLNSLRDKIEQLWQQSPKTLPQIGMFGSKNAKEFAKAGFNPKLAKIRQAHPPLMIFIAIASLTSLVGFRFYNQPQLAVDTIAPSQIRAPQDGNFEDTKTTEEKRKAIRTAIIPTLKRDIIVSQEITQQLDQLLDQISQLRSIAGIFPFINTSVLSSASQQYLRQAPESEWQTILTAINQNSQLNPADKQLTKITIESFQQLRQYQQKVSKSQSNYLRQRIETARKRYAFAKQQLFQEVNINPIQQQQLLLFLDLEEATWQQTKYNLQHIVQQTLTQGIPPGLPESILKESIEFQLNDTIPERTKEISIQLLLTILKTNLIEDPEETKRNAEQAAQAIEPEFVSVKEGEIIVEAGDIITQKEFVLLDGFGLSRRRINGTGLIVSGILVIGAVTVFCFVGLRVHHPIRRRDHVLLCLLSLSTPLLVIFDFPYSNIPAVGLLVSSFYNPTLAITHVALLSGLVAFSSDIIKWESLLAGVTGGILAASIAGRLRSREELALLGAGIGLTEAATYLIVNFTLSASAGAVWNLLLLEALLYGLWGIVWSVVALGISPYLERFFDLITPIRLAELSNPNRPLLKRLATEAPGTFQHTMFVASLAEAAARELHCNVELVRAGTLYHDIGKMHDPLGFIENQMGGPNKHDQINDPWESASIIKKHVSEGLVIARKYGLPKAIRDFIPEHQGTLLISYFYFQAKQRADSEQREVIAEDFRYDGPIPQSRETGIMMLADGCEAALRSLKDATPEQALSMVNKIFKARWQEQQLVDSGLKREELTTIAQVFVLVWQQYHHQRIAYPQAALEPQKRG